MLGGTQSLHTNSFDEAIALPTDFSARIARNTQLILAEESGVTAVADPLGGSWYVEALTRELEEKAWALIEEVEAHGGMTKAVAEGLPKHRIEEAAAARAAKVDTGETVIVGVNRYRLAEEEEHDILEVDNAKVRAGQIARIEKVRAGARRGEGAGGAGCAGARCKKSSPERGGGPCEAWWRGVSERAERSPLHHSLRRAVPLPVPGRSEPARPRRRSRPRPRHARRNFRRAGARVRALRHRCPSRCAGSTARRGATGAGKPPKQGTRSVADRLGRKPRIMVAKMGQDGHDRGANLVSSRLHRSRLRSDPRAVVPDPARDRANGGRA